MNKKQKKISYCNYWSLFIFPQLQNVQIYREWLPYSLYAIINSSWMNTIMHFIHWLIRVIKFDKINTVKYSDLYVSYSTNFYNDRKKLRFGFNYLLYWRSIKIQKSSSNSLTRSWQTIMNTFKVLIKYNAYIMHFFLSTVQPCRVNYK